ncbi:hypothetical protein JMUB7504_27710 [Staphylococcus aureus]
MKGLRDGIENEALRKAGKNYTDEIPTYGITDDVAVTVEKAINNTTKKLEMETNTTT